RESNRRHQAAEHRDCRSRQSCPQQSFRHAVLLPPWYASAPERSGTEGKCGVGGKAPAKVGQWRESPDGLLCCDFLPSYATLRCLTRLHQSRAREEGSTGDPADPSLVLRENQLAALTAPPVTSLIQSACATVLV